MRHPSQETSESTCFSKLHRLWPVLPYAKKTYTSPYALDPKFDPEGKGEQWENAWPTRTDLSKFETFDGEIVPIFGDSFMFGDGLPKRYCLSHILNRKHNYEKVYYLNLAKPGSGNETIMRRLEQWTNEEKSSQTKTIVIALSSIYRHAWYMNLLQPNIGKPSHPAYGDTLKSWDFKVNEPQDLGIKEMPRDSETFEKLSEELYLLHSNFKKVEKKASEALKQAASAHNLYLNGPSNSFIKNVEIIIRRLNWLTLAKKWNVIFVTIGFFQQHNDHKSDWDVVYKYLDEMNQPDRKIVHIHATNEAGMTGRLDCGHWDENSMKLLANKINEQHGILNNG